MDTLTRFGDNLTHYRTESVNFLGLINSAATKGFILFHGVLAFEGLSVDDISSALPIGKNIPQFP